MSYNYPTAKDSSHNEIKVPMNTKNICGVDCYEQNGVAYLRLENVARGLGFFIHHTAVWDMKRLSKKSLTMARLFITGE